MGFDLFNGCALDYRHAEGNVEFEPADLNRFVPPQILGAIWDELPIIDPGAVERVFVDRRRASMVGSNRRVMQSDGGVREANVGVRASADYDAFLIELVDNVQVLVCSPTRANAQSDPHGAHSDCTCGRIWSSVCHAEMA
ncbi:MAG: hypothetical protein AAF550_13000 [Myxococcota bacterium]